MLVRTWGRDTNQTVAGKSLPRAQYDLSLVLRLGRSLSQNDADAQHLDFGQHTLAQAGSEMRIQERPMGMHQRHLLGRILRFDIGRQFDPSRTTPDDNDIVAIFQLLLLMLHRVHPVWFRVRPHARGQCGRGPGCEH